MFLRRVSLGLELENDRCNKTTGASTANVYYRQQGKPAKESLHPGDMLVTLPPIKERTAEVLDSWFRNAETLRALYDLFFSAVFNPKMYLDFELLCYVHGLESYCSAMLGGKYVDEGEYEKVYRSLVSSIPDFVSKDFRQSIEKRAKYLNEYSQRKRLKEIIKGLGQGLETIFGGKPGEFIDSVVSTRDYLIHHDPADREKALRDKPLYDANQRLKLLIIILLLKAIGIDEEGVFKAISTNRQYGRLLG